MLPFKRASNGLIERWYFTVNKSILLIVGCLLIIGLILNLTSSAYIALRIGENPLYFFYRHLLYVFCTVFIIIGVSFFNKKQIIYIGNIIFIISIISIVLVLIFNIEVKGSKRWLYLFGISIQPSEFAKVCFPIVLVYFWEKYSHNKLFAYYCTTLVYIVTCFLILKQPDLGMVLLITIVFAVFLFLSRINVVVILIIGILSVLLVIFSYFIFSHVQYRIDAFFNTVKNYQIIKAIEALQNGGIFGVGSGMGVFKQYLPDAHTDFIFAVGVEEFGLVFAIFFIGLLMFLLYEVIKSVTRFSDRSSYLISIVLVSILVFQSIIHISSNINLIPTKGMTLPFISYGGSSLISNALLMGFILALTRKSY